MARKRDKKAKFGAHPAPVKSPVIREHHFEDGHPLAWRFGQTDKAGPFAWDIQPDQKFREVMLKLCEFESKNWNEITAGGSHPIATEKLCDEAKSRLVEIERDDLDELLSLRLAGKNRVWCIKSGHLLRPLWWDEEHQVYPVEKDKADRKKRRRRNG
ncbi:hypothetical protein CD351_09060 [Erythrobacter sp. KY5]|uniref:hypothetical protein n=1 Tax=Erythrobacter sp. KY5 TaxID=2011159 RepID=UPI000DBEFE91|nr:hypothetical protein [Erythrobacter sp. KY5]AWW74573.1 hypothetical protein CD351_09060 [Erythrobacter sp. KY5]